MKKANSMFKFNMIVGSFFVISNGLVVMNLYRQWMQTKRNPFERIITSCLKPQMFISLKRYCVTVMIPYNDCDVIIIIIILDILQCSMIDKYNEVVYRCNLFADMKFAKWKWKLFYLESFIRVNLQQKYYISKHMHK